MSADDPKNADKTRLLHNLGSDDEPTLNIKRDVSGDKTKTLAENKLDGETTLAGIQLEQSHGSGKIQPLKQTIVQFPGIRKSSADRHKKKKKSAPEVISSFLNYGILTVVVLLAILGISLIKKNSQLQAIFRMEVKKRIADKEAKSFTPVTIHIPVKGAKTTINGDSTDLRDIEMNVKTGQTLKVLVEKENYIPYETEITAHDTNPIKLEINLRAKKGGRLFYSTSPPSTISLHHGDEVVMEEFGTIANKELPEGKYFISVKNLNLGVDFKEEILIHEKKLTRIEKNLLNEKTK